MYRFIRLAIVILAFDFAAPAAAQDVAADMDFRGVSAIHITASPMSVESIDCNIDGSYLVRELQRQFEGDGLAKSADFDTLAVITVLSAREGGSGPCNSAVMLGAYKKASFFDNEAAWLRTGYVVIWQSALLVASPADTHLVLARDSLARLGQVMLKEWKDANSTSQ